MTITIPTDLNEVTVEQFIQYNRIINLNDVDEEAKKLGIVSCFCKVPLSETLKISVKDINDVSDAIVKLLDEFKKPNAKDFERKYMIWGKYGFIPNFDKVGINEYIDIELYLTDTENYHRALSVLYRPIDKKIGMSYTVKDYKGTDGICDEFLNMPLPYLLAAMVFFWSLNSDLLKATNVYLQNQVNQTSEALEEDLMKSGDGIQALIQLLSEGELLSRRLVN